jgi:hypothetical protein
MANPETFFNVAFMSCFILLQWRKVRKPASTDSQLNLVKIQSPLPTNTGRFIMFSVITNIYKEKTKGPTLMELFTATGKLKKVFFYN